MFREQDKEQLRSKLKEKATVSISMPSFNSYESLDNQLNNIKYSFESSIEYAICSVIDCLIDELYSHEDFEKDIGLR
jgi:hypothetical protein